MTPDNAEINEPRETSSPEEAASPHQGDAEWAAEETPGLTPEQIGEYKRVQKRRMIFALIAGIILMVLGFIAGQNLKQMRDSESAAAPISVVQSFTIELTAELA